MAAVPEETGAIRACVPPKPRVLSLNTVSPDNEQSCREEEEKRGRGGAPRYPWAAMFTLMTYTTFLSCSASGIQAVLELYFSTFLYICSKRAVRLASTSINIYIAVYQICALSGGYLADKVLGNFMTQVVSNIVSTAGLALVLFCSWQYTQNPPPCCNTNVDNCTVLELDVVWDGVDLHIPPSLNIALIIVGLMLFALGYGHTNAILSVFVADQFTEEQTKAKEYSFSWYYMFCNIGTLGGELGLPILRQSIGFIISFITLFSASFISTSFFVVGTCVYVRKKPENPHCRRRRRRRRLAVAHEDTSRLQDQPDETKPLLPSHTPPSSTTSTITTSTSSPLTIPTPKLSPRERLKQVAPFLGVFAPLVVFWGIFYQQSSTWIIQGTQMDCYIGKLHVPPDIMPSINDILCIIIIPLLDYLIYPHLQNTMNIKLNSIHKLVAGMLCAAFSFLMSALLQLYVHLPDDREHCHGDVNLMWQLPQLVLISFAEILVAVTGLELAYSHAPPDLRNLVTAFWFLSQALGVLLNVAIIQIPISLLYQFFLYFILMLLVTVVFVGINWNYENNRQLKAEAERKRSEEEEEEEEGEDEEDEKGKRKEELEEEKDPTVLS